MEPAVYEARQYGGRQYGGRHDGGDEHRLAVHQPHAHSAGAPRTRSEAARTALAVEARTHHIQSRKLAIRHVRNASAAEASRPAAALAEEPPNDANDASDASVFSPPESIEIGFQLLRCGRTENTMPEKGSRLSTSSSSASPPSVII